MEKRELVIIGAGPAGLSSAIYGRRAGLDVLILEKGTPGGQINITDEIARLTKELAKWQKEMDMVSRKLSNEKFVANAKPEVVEKEKAKQADYQTKFDTTQARIAELEIL